jgi:hypothetical protein
MKQRPWGRRIFELEHMVNLQIQFIACWSSFYVIVFTDVMDSLHKMIHPKTKMPSPMISDYHHDIIMRNADQLNSAIIYDRDFNYNYFGFKVILWFGI